MKLAKISFILFFFAFAGTGEAMENCFIDIKVTMKNGKVNKDQKKYQFKDKAQCKNLSEIYKENFSPKDVKKVEVEYKWLK